MIETLTERDKFFAEVDEAYNLFHANPELMYEYEAHQKWLHDQATYLAEAIAKGKKEGKADGLIEGKADGVKEGKVDAARNLKKLGVDIGIIEKATGLSPKEIEGL